MTRGDREETTGSRSERDKGKEDEMTGRRMPAVVVEIARETVMPMTGGAHDSEQDSNQVIVFGINSNQ